MTRRVGVCFRKLSIECDFHWVLSMSSFHSVSAYEYLSAKTTEYGVLAILSWSSSMNGVMTMSQSHYNDIVVSTDTYVSGRSVDRNVTWRV